MRTTPIIILLLLVAGEATAQESLSSTAARRVSAPQAAPRGFFGVRGGLILEDGAHAGPFIGIEVGLPVSDRFVINPNAELGAAHDVIAMLSGDVAFVLTPRSSAQLWVGAGVAYISKSRILASTRHEVGANLIFGVGSARHGVRPYVQAKAVLAEEKHFMVMFGIRF